MRAFSPALTLLSLLVREETKADNREAFLESIK